MQAFDFQFTCICFSQLEMCSYMCLLLQLLLDSVYNFHHLLLVSGTTGSLPPLYCLSKANKLSLLRSNYTYVLICSLASTHILYMAKKNCLALRKIIFMALRNIIFL